MKKNQPLTNRELSDLTPSIVARTQGGWVAGVLDASNIAGQMYNGSFAHDFDLTDCVLAKLNLLRPETKIRKNPRRPADRPMILTVEQIRQLAQFCGMIMKDRPNKLEREDERETPIAVAPSDGRGIRDGNKLLFYSHIAYYEEYPEEGAIGLGPKIKTGKAI